MPAINLINTTAMSIRIYSTSYKDPVPAGIWQPLLSQLPEELNQKVGKYRRWQDAHACLFGKHLLLAALRREGWSGNLNALQHTSYGRPYLPGGPDFNISHSGTRVVCILGSQGRVGIDLEEIRDIDIADFKDQFSTEEWQAILAADEPLDLFYHFWTAKECVSKADGRGLNLPLASLVIENNTTILLEGRSWNIREIKGFRGYACHMASEEEIEGTEETPVTELSPIEILTLSSPIQR